MKTEVLNSVKNIETSLFKELVDEQEELTKAYFRKDYEKVLLKTGKFTETLFQIFEFLQEGSFSQQPVMNDIENALAKLPEGSIPESIRIILPRLGKAIYSIRSKRGGGHKTVVPPQEVDAYVCLTSSQYVLAELLRLYSDLPEKKIIDYVRSYIRPKLPFIEEFENGDLMLLVETKSCKDKIMLILYHLYPQRASNDVLRKHLKGETSQNIISSLAFAEEKKLIHRSDEGSKLTELGKRFVEDEYSAELKA
ncbi:hypothetical protein HY489_05605 [Candidatus Woesearchaeota archaeon]|nr:hypothetical protein [Candidatus Woesearchaeota archaeon]